MHLFRLDASIRQEGSFTRRLADLTEGEWATEHPGGHVVRREIGRNPLPADAWGTAISGLPVAPEERSPQQHAAAAMAAALVDELLRADALLFAVPLYNFGVSQHFKTWVDLVLADPRMAPGGPSPLAGRPATLVTARGGAYGEGTPRAGWDHATGWMRRILADVWQLDLRVAEAELTLVDVNPMLEPLRDVAERSHAAAEDAARTHGRDLARQAVA